MMRPVYHALLETYGCEESEYSTPWYTEAILSTTKPREQPSKDLVEHTLEIGKKCPMNGSSRPDIIVLDKKDKEWIFIERTICNPGTMTMIT